MPSEKDYFSRYGFDIGPEAPETLKSCVAYKLCYYRFGEVTTEYNRPPGFDRARGKEVGDKNIKLNIFEEAFTSDHWIVRIYKVKKRPNLNSIKEISKKKNSTSTQTSKQSTKQTTKADQTVVKKIGCFISESSFGSDKLYAGEAIGANFNLAKMNAVIAKKRYFAIARGYDTGYSFAFNQLLNKPKLTANDAGCQRPCLDVEDKQCGCADSYCTTPISQEEEHNRRWVVYEIVSK